MAPSKRSFRHPTRLTIIVIGLAAIFTLLTMLLTGPPELKDNALIGVTVDSTTVTAKVAASDSARQTGLAGTSALDDLHGMYFVFPDLSLRQFWMKGMTYPIDIIWINGDTVSGVAANVPAPAAGVADSALPHYPSEFPVDRVLEVSAGWAAKHGIQPGDPVRLTRRVLR